MRGTTGNDARWTTVERFQCTCPVRGTTSSNLTPFFVLLFQCTCPVRGTTLPPKESNNSFLFQCTCPVRGTTCIAVDEMRSCCHFNVRAPCGAQPVAEGGISAITTFQCTCPVRGTTAVAKKPAAVSVLNPKNANLSYGFFQTCILSLKRLMCACGSRSYFFIITSTPFGTFSVSIVTS